MGCHIYDVTRVKDYQCWFFHDARESWLSTGLNAFFQCRLISLSYTRYFETFLFTSLIKRSRVRIPHGRWFFIVELHYFQTFFFCTHLINRSRVRIPPGRRFLSLNYTQTFFAGDIITIYAKALGTLTLDLDGRSLDGHIPA